MARAQAHFAAGRFPQAIGAYRAAIGLDPTLLAAHLGLADAMAARGRRDEAVDGLVTAAEARTEQDEHVDAMNLYGKALALDPARMDLHLEVAFVEEALGQHDAAVLRVESLAEHYMSDGRMDEAAELLRFAATWGEDEEPAEETPTEAAPNPALSMTPVHSAFITGATVIARNPLLDAPEAPAAPLAAPVVTLSTVQEPELAEPEFAPVEAPVDASELEEAMHSAIPTPIESGPLEVDAMPQVEHGLSQLQADLEPTVSRTPMDAVSDETEPDLDMVTQVARLPLPPQPTAQNVAAPEPAPEPVAPEGWTELSEWRSTMVPTQPAAATSTPTSDQDATVARAVVSLDSESTVAREPAANEPAPTVAQPSARAQVASRNRDGKLRLARTPRPGAATPAKRPSAASRRPSPVRREVPNPVVERLRARAGFGDAAATPRGSRIRPTEPISMRPPLRTRPEEEVTMRFRRPRGLGAAAC